MKFLLITYEYPPFRGGVARYLNDIMQAAPSSVSVEVETPVKSEHWIKTAMNDLRRAKARHIDLLAVSHVLPVGYIAWILKLFTKTPYIVFAHGTDILSARKSGWKRFWARFILKRAMLVIANSRFTAGLLKEEGIGRVEIVPPGVAISPHTLLGRERGNKMISIGRLVPRKGFDTLIKALPSIIKEVPGARAKIIGKGDYHEELDRLAHELRVESFVEIITDADDEMKNNALAEAAIFALPARQVGHDVEGFGIVTLEASAAGLPVVVGRSGGAAEPVIDNVTGIVVEPDDPKALAEAIVRLLKNPGEAQKMGEAGREHVAKEYSIEIIAKRFWNIIARPSTGSS